MNTVLDDSARKREQQALHCLEHPEGYPGLPARQAHNRRLRLWQYPAFEPYQSWTVFAHDSTAFVRRITWDRPGDARLELSTPTTYGSEAQLPSNDVCDIFSDLHRLVIPPFLAASTIVTHAPCYGIEFRTFSVTCRLQWLSSAPDEWQQLAEWFDRVVEYFESALPASTVATQGGP